MVCRPLQPGGDAHVYLDVSGSMNSEIGALTGLLCRLRGWIRSPFWAFSNEVAPARIDDGVLKTDTTGGTAMNCVLAHIARHAPGKALVDHRRLHRARTPALLGRLRAPASPRARLRRRQPRALRVPLASPAPRSPGYQPATTP